jgi:hypothetical protein
MVKTRGVVAVSVFGHDTMRLSLSLLLHLFTIAAPFPYFSVSEYLYLFACTLFRRIKAHRITCGATNFMYVDSWNISLFQCDYSENSIHVMPPS